MSTVRLRTCELLKTTTAERDCTKQNCVAISATANFVVWRKALECVLRGFAGFTAEICAKNHRRTNDGRCDKKKKRSKLTPVDINPGDLTYADAVGKLQ